MKRALGLGLAAGTLAAAGALAQSTAPASPAATTSPAYAPAAPAPATAEKPLAPFGWFADLSGSCWRGEHPDKVTTDTQCYLAQYERLIRGSIKGTTTQAGITRTAFEGDAVFAFNPNKSLIAYTQWGTGGTYGHGEATYDGAVLVFRNLLPDGTPANVRSLWRRTGPDGYRVVRERKVDDAWKEILAVDYKRVP